MERPIRRYLPPGEAPSKVVGEGTLLSRVAALERAMEALLKAQVRRGGVYRGVSRGPARWGVKRAPAHGSQVEQKQGKSFLEGWPGSLCRLRGLMQNLATAAPALQDCALNEAKRRAEQQQSSRGCCSSCVVM